MGNFDLNEQERIDGIKYFWKDWGKYIIALVVALIIGYIFSSIYQWHQSSQAKEAAQVYVNYTTALGSKDYAKVTTITDQMIKDLPRTEYTAMASMQTAKLAFDQKDFPRATKYLNWAKDNASDKSLQSIAALRLASVYIDQKQFDKAREVLKTKHDLAFDGLFYEARGDMYIAMGDLTKARDAYKEGLQKAANDPSTQQGIQMKLDVIGG